MATELSMLSPIGMQELKTSILKYVNDNGNEIIINYCAKPAYKISLNQGTRADGLKQFSVCPIYSEDDWTFREELEDIFDMSGLYDLEIEFIPSNEFEIEAFDKYYKIGPLQIRKKMETFNEYEDWFSKIFANLDHIEFYLVPDTNFLIRRYYSNYFRTVVKAIQNDRNFKHNDKLIQIMLSKLTIFELEKLVNDSIERLKKENPDVEPIKAILKNLNSKMPKMVSLCNTTEQSHLVSQISKGFKTLSKLIRKDKNINPEERKSTNERERRIYLQSLSDILSMIMDGAQVITSAGLDLISSFANAQGTKFADSWIRMEVMDFRDYSGNGRGQTRPVFFLTSDLTNALASVAENINTFYIYRIREIEKKKFVYSQIPLLIYNTAIVFGSCEVKFNRNSVRYDGDWGGKTPDDWRNEILMH